MTQDTSRAACAAAAAARIVPPCSSIALTLSDLGRHLLIANGVLDSPQLPEHIRSAVMRLQAALSAREELGEREFRESLVGAVPHLRAFAISLSRDPHRADDLVQETLLRGWSKRGRFERGTNLHAWLFTILRNAYFSEYRKRSREVEDGDGTYAARLATAPAQEGHLHLKDLQVALRRLSTEHRQALLLVAAEGLSYEEAAAVSRCAVGTVKSRVNRARTRLTELLGHTSGDFSADTVMGSALCSSKYP